jgi:hypothetical protein
MDDSKTTEFSVKRVIWTGRFPGKFDATIYNPYLSSTSSLPAASYLCFTDSDLRRVVTKVKYTLFLISLFAEQRSHLVANNSRSVTKVKYTGFLL